MHSTQEQVGLYLDTIPNRDTRYQHGRTLFLFIDYLVTLGNDRETLDINEIVPIFTKDGVLLLLGPINSAIIDTFIYWRLELGDSRGTLARHQEHLRKFFSYLRGKGLLRIDPMVSANKISRPQPKETYYLNFRECIALLFAAAKCDQPIRDFALIKLMLSTGLRPKELRVIQIGDLDFSRNRILIWRYQKNHHSRFVPLYPQVAADLKNYLGSAERKDKDGKELFLNNGKMFSKDDLNDRVKKLCSMAGISKPITAYGLRHTYATLLFHQGLDIYSIQRLLGHIVLKSTKVYTHGLIDIPDDPCFVPNAELLSRLLRGQLKAIK